MKGAGILVGWVVAAGCVIPDQPSPGCDPCHPCVLAGQVCVAGACVAAGSADAGGADSGPAGLDAGADAGGDFLPGELGPPDPAEVDGTRPHTLASATDGTNFLIAWADTRPGAPAVHYALFTPDGGAIAPGDVVLSAPGSQPTGVCATFDGRDYLIAWDDGSAAPRQVRAARVGTDGVSLDGSGFALAPTGMDELHPACAGAGGQVLVAWTDFRSDAGSLIYAARVSADGGLLDGSGFAASPIAGVDFAAVSASGADYLVAWSDPTAGAFPLIRGSRVTTAGQPLDTADGGLPLGAHCGAETLPALAEYGGEYVALWQDACTPSSRIYADRAYSDGGVADPSNLILSTSGASFAPAATASSKAYFFAWATALTPGPADVYFAWYLNTPPGNSFDHHASFFVNQTPQDEEGASIAINASYVVLVSYATRLGTQPWRVRARLPLNGSAPDASTPSDAGPGSDAGGAGPDCSGVAPPPSTACAIPGPFLALGGALAWLAFLARRRGR